MIFIILVACVVTAYHPGNTADAAADNIVIERFVGRSERAAQHVVDGFVRESGHHFCFYIRNVDGALVAVGEVVHCRAHDRFGGSDRVVLIKFNMGRALHHGLGRGGDHYGMETFGCFLNGLHDALHIHNHGVNRAGCNRKFLLQVVTSNRQAVAHQDFIGRAAHAGHVNAFRALLLCLLQQFGIL